MTPQMEDFLTDLYADFGGPGYGALPQYPGDRVRPHKGGGGGGEATAIEQERQKKAQEAINAINAIFDGANRDSLYQSQRDAVYALNTQDVNRQAQEMERNNRFGLARNGLLGGSVDVDSNAEINRRTNEGLAQAGGIADAAMSDLRSSDEQARNNLVNMAQAGTDATTASQLANNSLSQNADAAAADRAVASVGNLFGSMTNAYLMQNLQKYAQSLGSIYPAAATSTKKDSSSPQNTYSGSVS